MNGYAFGQRPWNVPSMISASVPQMAIAFTRHRTSFSRTGPGLVTSATSNWWGAVRTRACIYESRNAATRQMQPSPPIHRQGNAPTVTRRPATSLSSPPRFSSIGTFAFAMW